MALTKKQKELDLIKWNKSMELGKDACGSFDYCAHCDKSLENPCDRAYKKAHAKPAVKKETAEKPKKNACAQKKTTKAAK